MLDTDDCVVISLNKAKLFLMALGSLAFVALGIWFFVDPNGFQYDPLRVRLIGVAAIGVFGLSGLAIIAKLFDDRAGLVLDRQGVIDNSSAVAAGRIGWNEIRDIQVRSVRNQRFLVLLVDNPQRYAGRGNALKQYLAKANWRMTGSPITISSNALNVGFGELEVLMRRYRAKYAASAAQPPTPRPR